MGVSYLEKRYRELESYVPELTRRPDFSDFWDGMLSRAHSVPLEADFRPYSYPSPRLRVEEVTYHGFDETRIHAWLIRPHFPDLPERLPCLITYPGFNGSRGDISSFAHWALLGMAVLSVDVREQRGETGNSAVYTHGSATSVATKGLLDKNEYYYGAVYMDCVKAIDVVVGLSDIDPERVVLHGISQGGGIATAVSALDSRP